MDKDVKLIMDNARTYHGVTAPIAKMASVDVGDIEKMLSGVSAEVAIHSKYKIAVTAMALRFFLKDCEPTT